MGDDNEEDETEVVLEEVPEPHIIETGDSVKVKQVLDDSAMEAVKLYGYEPNYFSENLKLLLMFLSCVFAMVAQFYPIPFPQSRPLLGLCCAVYFIISAILQFIVTFIDKETIMTTKPHKVTKVSLKIGATFQRFQEFYIVTIQNSENKSGLPSKEITTGRYYVGKYFTSKGEFEEAGFQKDIQNLIDRFEHKKYDTFEYNHKLD